MSSFPLHASVLVLVLPCTPLPLPLPLSIFAIALAIGHGILTQVIKPHSRNNNDSGSGVDGGALAFLIVSCLRKDDRGGSALTLLLAPCSHMLMTNCFGIVSHPLLAGGGEWRLSVQQRWQRHSRGSQQWCLDTIDHPLLMQG